MEYYQLKAKAELAERMFERGAQSRQAEIDELQKRIDNLTNTNESLVAYKNQLLDDIEGNKND